jgi:hypothetical protein
MLALAGLLAPLFGLPRVVVVFIGLVNLAYSAFSFSLARQSSPARGRVRALVTANLLWVGVCVVTALYFAGPGTGWARVTCLRKGSLWASSRPSRRKPSKRPDQRNMNDPIHTPSRSAFKSTADFPNPPICQTDASSCLNASYSAMPTEVAKFNDRIRRFGIGIFKQRSQFALSNSSGNPRVSLPKTRQSFG